MIQFTEIINVLRDGLLEALREAAPYISSIERTARGDLPITGLSFELYPWHEYIALSIRGSQASGDGAHWYSQADWEHFEFITSQSCRSEAFRRAAETVTELYESWDEAKLFEAAHIIFLAAAEALLDKGVGSLLQELGVDAQIVGDELTGLSGGIEYMVFDSDSTINANYCEIVLANRVTSRLLGGEA
jgi:hypothetical protein